MFMPKKDTGLPTKRGGETLSDAALVVLAHAARDDEGMVLPLPKSVRVHGAASDKILEKLLRLKLIEERLVSNPDHQWRRQEDGSRLGLRISAKGLESIGVDEDAAEPNGASGPADLHQLEPATPSELGHCGASIRTGRRFRTKSGSKQAMLVHQLSSPGGCTLDELATALGWQRHTVRAAITGLRQKGFGVVRSKSPVGQAVYQISAAPANAGPQGS
jgi:biotin operon repressor